MEIIDKTTVRKSINNCILEGNFVQADILEKNNAISHIEVVSIVEKTYAELLQLHKYLIAIELVEHYNLPSEKRSEAINAQFRQLTKNKEYEKAIEWATQYKLPDNEINTVAVKAFTEALDARKVEDAISYKKRYNIPVSMVSNTVMQWFNVLFDQQKYYYAFLLGQEFDVSRKRTLTAGVQWYQQLLEQGDIAKFVAAEGKYTILGDRDINQINSGDIRNFNQIFIITVIKGLFNQNKIDVLTKIISSLNIFDNRVNNSLLGTLAKQIADEVAVEHNTILEQGRYLEAIRLTECFHLLADEITLDIKVKVIEAAESAHHKLFGENNLRIAKLIKEKYELFERNIIANSLETVSAVTTTFLKNALANGNVADAKVVIQDYGIMRDVLQEIVNGALVTLLRERKYIEAFEIIRELKISVASSEIQLHVASAFEDAYTSGQMELATNIAYYFDIKDKRRVQAAFILWQKQMELAHFDRALEIKKIHKIPGKMTEPVVKEIYNQLLTLKKTDKAIMLRQHYRLNLSIWEWFMELIKKYLHK